MGTVFPTTESARLKQRMPQNLLSRTPPEILTREAALELARTHTFDLQFYNGDISSVVETIESLMQEHHLTEVEVGFDRMDIAAQQMAGFRWEANHRLTLARRQPSQAARGRFLGEDAFEKCLQGPTKLGHPALTHEELGTTPEEIAALRAETEPRPM